VGSAVGSDQTRVQGCCVLCRPAGVTIVMNSWFSLKPSPDPRDPRVTGALLRMVPECEVDLPREMGNVPR
jgi:hypothetical protein